MQFATHAALAGVPAGGARLDYLLTSKQPLYMQYRLNWHAQIRVMRELYTSFFKRVVHAPVAYIVNRLFGRLPNAQRLDRSHGASWRPVAVAFMRHAKECVVAVTPQALFFSGNDARLVAAAREGLRTCMPARAAVAKGPYRSSRHADLRARQMPQRTAVEKLTPFFFRRLMESVRTHPAYRAKPPRFSNRVDEAIHPSASMLASYSSEKTAFMTRALVHLRMFSTIRSDQFAHWRDDASGPEVARGLGASLVAFKQGRLVVPSAGLKQLLALFQRTYASGTSLAMHAKIFMPRLLRVYREGARWSRQTVTLARNVLTPSSDVTLRKDASAPPFQLQTARQGSDVHPAPAAWPLRHAFASRGQEGVLELAQARHELQAMVSLPREHEPLLPTPYVPSNQSSVALMYRQGSRPPAAQVSRQVQRIEQQITRKIVHDITQATPWRSDVEKAVLTPQVVRRLAEQVGGMMAQRIGLERYRRGL
jgi:hypothetical protein